MESDWRCGCSFFKMWWFIGGAPAFPGSNPASPTMILGAAGSLCNTVKSQGRGGNLHLKKNKKLRCLKFLKHFNKQLFNVSIVCTVYSML